MDYLADSRESRARRVKLESAINLIESHGYEVVYYRPDMGCKNALLAQAFNTIRQSSFVVMDKDGLLFGNRASIKQMTNDEKALEKRRRFFVVDGK
ncbi:hypothetical protein [Rhodoferax ferrireducens]|uniref:hypothetical protein n=1 Tax=Rhodoferax ferrireducens TaxID=192843 RepID=UPI00140FDDFE|nr:hypothetical protein [Rhodoferax ferrireducens]